MKKILSLILLSLSFTLFANEVYEFKLKTPGDETLDLKEFKNKAILFVNIATQCGYTGQLDGLEKTYQKYKSKDLVVIGIPSNDFGGQTPESNQDVAKFCKLNYGVTFPLTQKMKVKGDDKSPLYNFLISKTEGNEVAWNFTKFLFDKRGNLVKRYESSIKPEDKNFIDDIEKILK